MCQIDAHQDEANALSFADDSSHIIASGGDDGICKVSYVILSSLITLEPVSSAHNSVVSVHVSMSFIHQVWDRRTLSEAHPVAVGLFAGHKDGITFIDSKVHDRLEFF